MNALEWIDDRWHLDGRPIHAGTILEMRGIDEHRNEWFTVRIESSDRGRRLYAVKIVGGHQFSKGVEEWDELRWPE